jgi:hypothetical protein
MGRQRQHQRYVGADRGRVDGTSGTINTSAIAQPGLGSVAAASLQATIDLTLTSPQPLGGRLVVRMVGGPPTQALDYIDLDIGADGSIEFRIAASQSDPGTVDLPLAIPATGAVVRVAFRLAMLPFVGATPPYSTSVGLDARFFPGEPAISVFDTTGAGAAVGIGHPIGSGSATLSIGTPAETPVLMAIGAFPTVVPLLPTVTVSPDVTLAGLGSITLPLPPFPAGTAIWFQGLVIDIGGTPRSTPSVRALWL